jgi:hypothetical protein
VRLELYSDGAVDSPTPVSTISAVDRWPGHPLLAVIDGRVALVAASDGERVTGHWGTAPALVAAARLAIAALARSPTAS